MNLAGQGALTIRHDVDPEMRANYYRTTRPHKALVPTWVILIEGASEVALLQAVCRNALPKDSRTG